MKNEQNLYLKQFKDIYSDNITLNNTFTFENNLNSFYNKIKNCTKCSLSSLFHHGSSFFG